ncbi:hypothetical protein DPEC_G00076550 [Dallia pectoralis]|uniref:Uncharacterized protein n=1 Tax=Dallia pectoralis TaxID=75939 RepID=A0ACC2H4G5_DALPE|nr:hypothetical protein DPEC_G00076550 [Dallia pectoralis]
MFTTRTQSYAANNFRSLYKRRPSFPLVNEKREQAEMTMKENQSGNRGTGRGSILYQPSISTSLPADDLGLSIHTGG